MFELRSRREPIDRGRPESGLRALYLVGLLLEVCDHIQKLAVLALERNILAQARGAAPAATGVRCICVRIRVKVALLRLSRRRILLLVLKKGLIHSHVDLLHDLSAHLIDVLKHRIVALVDGLVLQLLQPLKNFSKVGSRHQIEDVLCFAKCTLIVVPQK